MNDFKCSKCSSNTFSVYFKGDNPVVNLACVTCGSLIEVNARDYNA